MRRAILKNKAYLACKLSLAFRYAKHGISHIADTMVTNVNLHLYQQRNMSITCGYTKQLKVSICQKPLYKHMVTSDAILFQI